MSDGIFGNILNRVKLTISHVNLTKPFIVIPILDVKNNQQAAEWIQKLLRDLDQLMTTHLNHSDQ